MCYTFLETFLSIELEYVKKKVFFYRDHWSLTPVRQKTLSHIFKKKIFSLIFDFGEKTLFFPKAFFCQNTRRENTIFC